MGRSHGVEDVCFNPNYGANAAMGKTTLGSPEKGTPALSELENVVGASASMLYDLEMAIDKLRQTLGLPNVYDVPAPAIASDRRTPEHRLHQLFLSAGYTNERVIRAASQLAQLNDTIC